MLTEVKCPDNGALLHVDWKYPRNLTGTRTALVQRAGLKRYEEIK